MARTTVRAIFLCADTEATGGTASALAAFYAAVRGTSALYHVDEGEPSTDLLGEENGETSIAKGLPRRSDSGGADDLKVGLADYPLRSCRVDRRRLK